jgi:hypothetical protein
MFRDWFEWRWVGVAFVLCLGLNLVAFWAVQPVLEQLLRREEHVLTGAGLLGGVTLGICFVCGLVVARLALRRAVREPAVASVLAVLAMALFQLRLGMVNVAGAVLGAPLCFAAGYLGGRLGWSWRKRALKRTMHLQ